MYRSIPLHSLVLAVGDCPEDRTEQLQTIFPRHEVLSVDAILAEMIGPAAARRPDLLPVAEEELVRRVSARLALGERVVVNDPFQRREDREAIARLGTNLGLPVVYLLFDEPQSRELQRGDGLAEIIDMRAGIPTAVRRLLHGDAIREHHRGITVVGDVHGSLQAVLSAIRWARSRQHYVVFTGDIVSYGPASLDVADEVHRMVCAGEASFLMGNHERKILRWLDRHVSGRDVRLSDGNRVTTQAIAALSPAARRAWTGRFRGLVQQSEIVLPICQFVFAHAAIHPDVWSGGDPRRSSIVHDMAMFGEFEHSGGRFAHTYRWVDGIPPDRVAIVGHDIRSRSNPFVVVNSRGGRAVFLDTGCGKGGRLSTADLRFTGDGMLKLLNFNLH